MTAPAAAMTWTELLTRLGKRARARGPAGGRHGGRRLYPPGPG